MTRGKATEDDSDTEIALSRTRSIPRMMSGLSSNSDDSVVDSDTESASEDGNDVSHGKAKKKKVFASTAEEADMIANMTYMQRRKYMSRVRIVFNTTSE